MSDFWSHFYFKKIGIEYIIIFYNNKSYLIYGKANSKFLISGHAESPKVVDISNNPSTWKSDYF